MKKILIAMFLCLNAMGYGQSLFNMPLGNNNGSGTRFVTCSGSFNDSGQQNNYMNNENGLATFCPGVSTDRMQLDFFQVDILAGDVLTIFDGDSITAPVLGTITNTTTAAGLFQASPTNPTGCLTARFISNGSGNAAGWRAIIACFNPCQSIVPNIVTTPATDADGILRICQGETVNFNGTATFSVDGTGATYEWDLGNGNGTITGQNQSETYINPGVYFVKFDVTDVNGCFDREVIDLIIQVSTDPNFTGTRAANSLLCFGDSTTLTGVVVPQQFALSPSPPIAGTTFLPDGSGVSYQTCINVDLFAPGATVLNAGDLVNIFLNMEHSYLGDLAISITAPNGATVSLHDYPSGGNTFLGQPIDIDTDLNPGVGFNYVFTEGPSATRTWTQWVNQVGGATVPAGNYRPVDPFSRFIGSPLNGPWCINITDNLGSDNGFIFNWGLNFNPAIIPPALSFTPGVATRAWLPNPDITNTAGNVITVQPATSGLHCYDYEFVDSFGCTYIEQVCINVQPEIASATPPDVVLCVTPGSGTTVFDLTQDESITYNGLNPSLYTINYHNNLANAVADTNPITSPGSYTPGSNSETIFISVRDNATQCIKTHSFTITAIDFGTISIPDYEQCDDIVNFDLDAYTAPFLATGGSGGTGLNGFTITYHTTLVDAQLGLNEIMNSMAYSPANATTTIYVRIVSNTDATCSTILPFDLISLGQPTATQPMSLILCDTSGSNALTASFNLGAQNAAILNGQSSTAFTVTYHDTQAAADANTGTLSLTAYTNTVPVQTIFARVENATASQCFTTTSFNIQVDPQAQFNAVNDLEVCDDISNDGVEIFDLTTQNAGVLGSQNAADFIITYHTSNADAQAGTPAITNPASYMNNGNPQVIYVRVTPVVNATCFATGTFQLIVAQQAVANPVTPLVQCDDASNDGVASYDLTSSIAEVLGTQDPNNFTVTVHESQVDANNNVNPVSVNFTNTTAPQTLIARIENNANTTCFRTTPISLILNEAPRITTPADLILCDDVSGDGSEIFDLTLNNTDLLNGLNPADYTITYYLNQNDANTGVGATGSNYPNTTTPEAIFVRVVNNMTSCVNTVSFNIILNPIPATTTINPIEECDDDLGGTAVFSLSDRTTAIINGQTNRSVLFYANAADAIAGTNVIDENSYTNTSNPQTISYRLINGITGCYAIGDFVIEAVAAPSISTPSDVENCDDGTGNASANLEASTPGVIGTQMGLQVTYHDSQAAANNGTNALSSPYDYTANETVFVRVEDINSGCVSFTTLDLIFNELPQPLLLEQYIICKDIAGNLLNGPAVLNSNLDNATYRFVWTRDGNIIAGATQAIYNATEPGDYVVTATNRSTGCSDETSTVVRQSGAPQIYDVQVTTDPFSFQHNVIATASGPDNYWFRLDDGPYENSGIFNNVPPGPHTVTVAERNGCGEIVVDIFVYGYPDYFTPNNDGYHDTWNIIGGDLLPGTKLYIFDRYGKLLKQLDPSGAGWDGTYNGQPLPSSDYWFRIEYLYENRSANASGHFAMKR